MINCDTQEVKLIDFGLSAKVSPQVKFLETVTGTSYYMAPEVIAGRYNEKADTWALGVALYYMCCGKYPFDGEQEIDVYSEICKGNYDFSNENFINISSEAKSLIK